jgi:hypothetical protein
MVECKYSSIILDLGTRMEENGELHASVALTPGNSPSVPIG